jgi:hypothetical protein
MLYKTIDELIKKEDLTQEQEYCAYKIIEIPIYKYTKYYAIYRLGKEPIFSFFYFPDSLSDNTDISQFVFPLDNSQNKCGTFGQRIRMFSLDIKLEFVNHEFYYYYVRLHDISENTNINKGIGTFGIKNIQELCEIENFHSIRGYISDKDFDDKKDKEHGERLIHFYQKNNFGLTSKNNFGKKYEILWKNKKFILKDKIE